jgi:hypothetical protein
MKNSDESIDRVMAGLREVEAPEGIERRVLAAIEERAAARAGYSWRMWPVGFAAAVVVVAAVVVSVMPGRVHRPGFAVVKLPAVAHGPVPVALVQKRNTEVLRVAQNDLRFHVSRRDEPAVEERVVSGGIPAPPMPLTEQEKLLVRLAHRSDPQELTPLIAEDRERLEAEFDAEFQEFFAPPAPVTEEKQTDPTMNDKGESR